jgi:acetyltransferase
MCKALPLILTLSPKGMVALARKLGFTVDVQLEECIVGLTLHLMQPGKQE